MRPKLHYLLHLAEQILRQVLIDSCLHLSIQLTPIYRFGPLRHQSCIRFEAKNHHLKRLVGLNFKNVPKSVAERHRYYMCLQLLSPPGISTNFLYKGDVIGAGKIAMPCMYVQFIF